MLICPHNDIRKSDYNYAKMCYFRPSGLIKIIKNGDIPLVKLQEDRRSHTLLQNHTAEWDQQSNKITLCIYSLTQKFHF